MPPISKTLVASLVSGLLAAGCGGGGSSGSGGAATATTFPLSTALANLYATGFSKPLTVNGTATFASNGTRYTFTAPLAVAQSPANAGATFEGQPASDINWSMTGTFNINGTNSQFSSTSNSFLSPSNLLLGIQATSYCVANSPGQYPDTVAIGQTQSVATYTCYKDSTKTSQTGTAKVSFIVAAGDAPNTVKFSVLETFDDAGGSLSQFTQKNFLIDATGSISFQSLSFIGALTSSNSGPSNAVQLTFQSQ